VIADIKPAGSEKLLGHFNDEVEAVSYELRAMVVFGFANFNLPELMGRYKLLNSIDHWGATG